MEEVEREILVPVVHALKRARRPFRGVLYAGLMLTNQGPKVLEFNVRFGDPETQAILMRLKSDLLEAIEAVVDERLDSVSLEWDPRPAVTVVMASEGYPGHYERDHPIQNLDAAERHDDVKVFHAGTTLRTEPGTGVRPGWSATAAACSTSRPWAPPWPRHETGPTRRSAPSASPAVTIAATSPSGTDRASADAQA